jgi:predicted ATP-grasp superfamily ATP-dependent carboligase
MAEFSQKGNVLVLGDDMRIFLAVTRALGRAGKRVHALPFDHSAPALRSRFISKIHQLPDYTADKGKWTSDFRSLCQSEKIDLVIPCTDPCIIMLHEQRDQLTDIRLAIPGPDAMDWLFDKELTHKLCDQLSVSNAPARRLANDDAVDELVWQFALPMVLKPRRSYWNDQLDAADKVYIPETRAELQAALSSITNPDRYLVEGYFEGSGIGISVLANDGKIFQAYQHRRLREGRGGSSTLRRSEAVHPGMLEDCRKICMHMRHTGVCMFEFRLNDQTGQWILLETNARFWGSMGLTVSLGVDYPNALYALMVEGRETPQFDYRTGVLSRNFLLDGLNILRQFRRDKSALGLMSNVGDFVLQPLRWMTGKEVSDGFVRDDMSPGLAELRSAVRTRN